MLRGCRRVVPSGCEAGGSHGPGCPGSGEHAQRTVAGREDDLVLRLRWSEGEGRGVVQYVIDPVHDLCPAVLGTEVGDGELQPVGRFGPSPLERGEDPPLLSRLPQSVCVTRTRYRCSEPQ